MLPGETYHESYGHWLTMWTIQRTAHGPYQPHWDTSILPIICRRHRTAAQAVIADLAAKHLLLKDGLAYNIGATSAVTWVTTLVVKYGEKYFSGPGSLFLPQKLKPTDSLGLW